MVPLALALLLCAGAVERVQAAQAGGNPCDRSCLLSMAARYAAALVAHDPGRLPVTADVKFTENLVPLKYGEQGLWKTVDGRRAYDIYAADTQTGNAVWIGIVKENDTPVMMAARIKVVGHRVTELETLVGRSALSAAATVRAPRPDFSTLIPPAERASRARLIAIADSNWDAMQHSDGSLAPYAVDCERYDNGMRTTHGRSPGPGAAGRARVAAQADDRSCFGEMSSGRFNNGNTVEPRRIWAVDPAYGLVVGLFTPNVPGTVRTIELRNGKTLQVPAAELAPFTIEQVEMFRIVKGQISKVEVVLGPRVPYGMRSPFDMATKWQPRPSSRGEGSR